MDVVDRKITEYKKWLDKDHIAEYAHVEALDRQVLITVFYYWSKDTSLILDAKLKLNTFIQFFPVAKVIAVGPLSEKGLYPGKIIYLSDRIMGEADNPSFHGYMRSLKDSAKDDVVIPPGMTPFIKAIENWRNLYGFRKDKLSGEISEQDMFTFLMPDTLITAGERNVDSGIGVSTTLDGYNATATLKNTPFTLTN